MDVIFQHTDGGGDSMEVSLPTVNTGTSLFFDTDPHGDGPLVRVDRDDVIRLRDALNEWIEEAPQPVADTVTRSELVAAMDQLRAELRPPAVPGTVCAPVITRDPMTPEEVWGPDCVTCGHSSGVHTTLHGCGAAYSSGGSCPCAGFRRAS